MRLTTLSEVGPQDRLGRTLFNHRGQPLVKRGTPMTPSLVQALVQRGYQAIFIENPLAPDLDAHDAVSEATRLGASVAVRNAFTAAMSGKTALPVKESQEAVESIIRDLSQDKSSLAGLAVLRGYDEYQFVHAVNVAILSVAVGVAIGMAPDQLLKLGVGALLHDIGMLLLPEELRTRTGALAPEERDLVMTHAKLGFDLLRKDPAAGPVAAHVALQHHERWDGSGYPRRLAGEGIHVFGRIVALADVFDALCSERPYRPAQSLWEAASYLASQRGRLFDPELTRVFVAHLALYPNGTAVQLRNGMTAVVIAQTGHPMQPRIRLLGSGEELQAADEHAIVRAVEAEDLQLMAQGVPA